MDQKSLIAWRKNPKLIGKDEVRDLENLLQEFPYFSMGQILLAKGYKNLNHYKLAEQIRKATLYCQDREWFYHFIHSDNPSNVKAPEKPIRKEKVKESKVAEPAKSIEPEVPKMEVTVKETAIKKTLKEKPFILKKESAWKTEKPVVTSKEIQEEVNKEVKKEEEEKVELPVNKEVPKKRGRPKVVKLEKDVAPAPKRRGRPPKKQIEDKIETSTPKRRGRPPKAPEEEVTTTPKRRGRPPKAKEEEKTTTPKRRGRPPKKQIEDKKESSTPKRRGRPPLEKKESEIKQDTKKANEKVKPLEKKEAKATPKKPNKKKKKSKKKKAKVVLDEKALLDELMLSNIQYNLEDHFTLEEELAVEEKSNTDEPTDFFSWLKSTDEKSLQVEKKTTKKKKDGKDENKPHKSLVTIEKFLSNKSNAKKKVSFYSPAEMAKRSDSLESEIVSETLAKLYEEQERYPEAILTYEKLILLFPQKETYFATRIKNLRKLDKK